MARHKVAYKILLFTELFAYIIILISKAVENLTPGLSHIFKYVVRDMLRSNFQLSRNVMSAKLVEKFIAIIVHHIVIADTASDKYLFDSGKCTKLSEES